MSDPILLVRRQSPDWGALSEDYRSGRPIDPSRYVPDHEVYGFPARIDRLIDQWNRRFGIDFFTFRHAIAMLSRRSMRAVVAARRFDFEDLDRVAAACVGESYVYFHDDDDFFAPDLAHVVGAATEAPDAIVTPLFRVGVPTLTFVREGYASDVDWGERTLPSFRFQTNNYGIHARRCRGVAELRALKDHVLGSAYADDQGFRDQVLSAPVSATVKTPGSASMLPIVFASDDSVGEVFAAFVREAEARPGPPGYGWITGPLKIIADLVAGVARGDGYAAVDRILAGSSSAIA